MFRAHKSEEPQRIGFLLLENFSMIAFTAAIEPLRAANRIARASLYEWSVLSLNGAAVKASNGLSLTPDAALDRAGKFSSLFVCAGTQPARALSADLASALRRQARAGVHMGSLCTGSLALADAGLLTGHRCTIHWENMESFAERYPDLDITATVFEIDGNRYTCSGGTAPLDMMLYAIKLAHGPKLSRAVAEQMLHNFTREPQDSQRMALGQRTGLSHPKLLSAISYMEAHIENPAPLAVLAKEIDLSLRQLERLFKAQINISPAQYYLGLRLHRARLLLRQTGLSVLEIAIASGFNSAAHFSRAYKAKFAHAPRIERRLGP